MLICSGKETCDQAFTAVAAAADNVVAAGLTGFLVLLVLLVPHDDLHAPLLGVRGVEHLVEAGIALLLVHPLDEHRHLDRVGLGAKYGEKYAKGERLFLRETIQETE